MVVGGLPIPKPDHAEAVVAMALDMLEALADFNAQHQFNLTMRIGINSGPVVAGVIGTKKFMTSGAMRLILPLAWSPKAFPEQFR